MLNRKKIKDKNFLFLYIVLIGWFLLLYKTVDLDFLYKKHIKVTFSEDDSIAINDIYQSRNTKYLHTLYVDEINFPVNAKVLTHDHLNSVSRFNLKNNFFADFDIIVTVIEEGPYEFSIKSDDGFVFALDGKELTKFGQRREFQEDQVITFLTKGTHFMKLVYFQASGRAGLELRYKPLNQDGPGYFLGRSTRYIVF